MRTFSVVTLVLLAVFTMGSSCNNPPCDSSADATYWVSAPTRAVGPSSAEDGSQIHPFGTITAAVAAGEAKNACSVTINIAAGRYEGNLDLTLNAHLSGAGQGSTYIIGTISADSHDLTLNDLTVDGATGTAVSVNLASFTGSNLGINNTKAIAGDATSGRGLFLKNVAANLNGANFSNNAGQALVVSGILSTFKALAIGVSGSHVNPDALAGQAAQDPVDYQSAVLISNYARADIGILQVNNSQGIAIGVSTDAKAYLTYVGIDQISAAVGAAVNVPGHGLVVSGDAVAEVHNFDFKNGGGCGVFLLGGYMTGFDGTIELNEFPYCIGDNMEPGYPAADCLLHSNVVLQNNTKPPYIGGELPIPNQPLCTPGQPCPQPTPPPLSACATVPRL